MKKEKNLRLAVSMVLYDPDKFEVRGGMRLHKRASTKAELGLKDLPDFSDTRLPMVASTGTLEEIRKTMSPVFKSYLQNCDKTAPHWTQNPVVALEADGPVEY